MTDAQTFLKFLHVGSAILFIGTIFTTLIWKAWIEYSSNHTPTLHLSNKLLLWLDATILLPAVVTLYLSGSYLAALQALPIGGTKWIAISLTLLIITGCVWLGALIPIELYLLRQTSKGIPRRQTYRRFVWLWLVISVCIKAAPLLSLWLMVSKPTT